MNAENMYDAWDNGDRYEIRQQFARREEITRMAREAGFITSYGGRETASDELLERFAALVAAAEREACAKVVKRNAVAIWEKQYKDVAPQWKPLDDLMGVLTQIDNMTSGLSQPRREWVGLTDEEKLRLEIMGGKSDVMLAEAIEAKLREKNA